MIELQWLTKLALGRQSLRSDTNSKKAGVRTPPSLAGDPIRLAKGSKLQTTLSKRVAAFEEKRPLPLRQTNERRWHG